MLAATIKTVIRVQRELALKPGSRLILVLRWTVILLILRVNVGIVAVYGDYLPPDFSATFLIGRETTFFGSYQWAFYTHIAVGPVVLVLGMLLLSRRFRLWRPRWHARLGRVQVLAILLLLSPSGFWMAFYAQGDLLLKAGFALLAVVTGVTAACGWRAALKRQFALHELWMQRSYLLLCSAVVTRILGGFFLVTGIEADWTYYLAAWASWLVPWAIFELLRRITRKPRKSQFDVVVSVSPES